MPRRVGYFATPTERVLAALRHLGQARELLEGATNDVIDATMACEREPTPERASRLRKSLDTRDFREELVARSEAEVSRVLGVCLPAWRELKAVVVVRDENAESARGEAR